MKRRRNRDGSLTNVLLREQIAFATATRAALIRLGAKQVGEPHENQVGSLVVSLGEFELDTKAGPLRVTAYGDWIHSRFVFPQGESNGKWNFHKFNVGLALDQDDPERKLLCLFLERLRPILKE